MSILFQAIALTTLFSVGVRLLVQPERGLLLAPLGRWLDKLKGWKKQVFKPVFTCIYCMSSFWSLVTLVLFGSYGWIDWYDALILWPFAAVASVASNGIVYSQLSALDASEKLHVEQLEFQRKVNGKPVN